MSLCFCLVHVTVRQCFFQKILYLLLSLSYNPLLIFHFFQLAYYSVYVLRKMFDLFSGYAWGKLWGTLDERKWLRRIVFLETVAGVPGMVGAMVRHLRSLRHNYGQRSRLDTHSTRCVHVCACVWVGVGALVVHLIKSGLITQRTL